MHDRDSGPGGLIQYRGDNSTGTLITSESSGLNCNKSVEHLPQLAPLPDRCQLAVFAGPGDQRRVYSGDAALQGSTSHSSHTVFILQIILEF